MRNSVFKAGNKQDPNNYRGITVLPVFEKIFETAVQKRLECVNEIFCRNDKYNGGFLKGCHTSDNPFILQSLVERQINLSQSMIVCFVDFAKAFYLVNRNILFYKIIKSGLHGRVIDTFKFKFFIFPKNTSEATHFNNTLNTYRYQWEGKQKKQCLSRCLPREN